MLNPEMVSLRRRFLAYFYPLRMRILALLVGVLALMLALIVISVILYVYRADFTAWRGRQGEAARSAAQTVDAFLHQIETALEIVSTYGQDEIRQDGSVLAAILERFPALIELVYLDNQGNVLASAPQDQAVLANLFTIPQSEWFRAARSGRLYYSRMQISSLGEPYLIFALPSAEGGVLTTRIRMDVISDVVSDIRFGETGRVYIINQQGQIIAHTDPRVVLSSSNIRDHPEFAAILQSPSHAWYGQAQDLNGQAVVVASAAVKATGWIVITELPVSEAYANSRQAAINLTLLLLILGGLAIYVLSRVMHTLFLQPVDLLRSGATQFGQGNLSYRIAIPRPDELGQVMSAFNDMADRLSAEQDALRQLNDELESRVQARTHDLTQLNETLSQQIQERTQAEDKSAPPSKRRKSCSRKSITGLKITSKSSPACSTCKPAS